MPRAGLEHIGPHRGPKAEFIEYVESSGAKSILSQAMVSLARAALSEGRGVQPAAFLYDHFSSGAGGAHTARLSESEQMRVREYLEVSGANDLLVKALVQLFESPDRPQNPADFFINFFFEESGGRVGALQRAGSSNQKF